MTFEVKVDVFKGYEKVDKVAKYRITSHDPKQARLLALSMAKKEHPEFFCFAYQPSEA